jgi:hypothetical protein
MLRARHWSLHCLALHHYIMSFVRIPTESPHPPPNWLARIEESIIPYVVCVGRWLPNTLVCDPGGSYDIFKSPLKKKRVQAEFSHRTATLAGHSSNGVFRTRWRLRLERDIHSFRQNIWLAPPPFLLSVADCHAGFRPSLDQLYLL